MPTPIEFLTHDNGKKVYFLKKPLTNNLIEAFIENEISHLVIRDYHTWEGVDLDRLNLVVRSIFVEDKETPLGFLNDLKNLEELYICKNTKILQFSNFKNIKSLYFNRISHLPEELSNCHKLRELKISHSKVGNFNFISSLTQIQDLELNCVRTDSLAPLNSLQNLRYLTVNRSKEESFNFIVDLPFLESLDVSHFPNIKSLVGLNSHKNLQTIRIECFKNLDDLGSVGDKIKLNRIAFVSCPVIKSVVPLTRLENLESVLLWERTNILDGDIRCLLSLPKLRRLSFLNRKHYNLKIQDLKNMGF